MASRASSQEMRSQRFWPLAPTLFSGYRILSRWWMCSGEARPLVQRIPLGDMGARVPFHPDHSPFLHMDHGVASLVAAEALGFINRRAQAGVLLDGLQSFLRRTARGFARGTFRSSLPTRFRLKDFSLQSRQTSRKEVSAIPFSAGRGDKPFMQFGRKRRLAAHGTNQIRHKSALFSISGCPESLWAGWLTLPAVSAA